MLIKENEFYRKVERTASGKFMVFCRWKDKESALADGSMANFFPSYVDFSRARPHGDFPVVPLELGDLTRGDEVEDKNGDRQRVLGRCGDTVILSMYDDKGRSLDSMTVKDMESSGLTPVQPDFALPARRKAVVCRDGKVVWHDLELDKRFELTAMADGESLRLEEWEG